MGETKEIEKAREKAPKVHEQAPPPEPLSEPPKTEDAMEQPDTDTDTPEAVNENPQSLRTDQVNENLLNTATDVLERGGRKRDEQEEGGDSFDTLPLKIEEKEEGGGQENNSDIRNAIAGRRKGNLYQAVLVARTLEKGKKNPMASGRFSRFLSSSAWDTATDMNMIADSGIKLLTTFEKNSTAKTVFQAASLITNLVSVVTTSRNLIVKAKRLFGAKGKDESVIDQILLGLGIVGDVATLMVKGVSIIKTIVSLAGKNSEVINKISSYMFLLTGATQIIGAANSIRGLQKGFNGLKDMKVRREELRGTAMSVVERHKGLQEGKTGSWSEKECVKAAKALYYDKEANLSEDERDSLMLYIGMTKKVDKLENAQLTAAAGLLNLFIGFVSTGVGGAQGIVNGNGVKNKTLKDAATGMGAVANVSVMATSSVKLATRAADAGGSRKKLVKEGLWEKVKLLTQEEHGLRGLYERLGQHPPGPEGEAAWQSTVESAQNTDKLYEKTEGQLKTMGVTYGKLIQADSLDTFKNLLVDGI